jgi:hypothetical protein
MPVAEVSAASIAKKLDNAGLTDDEKAALTGILISALNGANEVEGFLFGGTAGTSGVTGAPTATPSLVLPSSLTGAQVLSTVGTVVTNPVGSAGGAGWAGLTTVVGLFSGATVSGISSGNITFGI